VSNINFALWKGGVPEIFPVCPEVIQCVECGITEIYLLLVAGNLLKYILLLLFVFGFETYRPIGRQLSGR
jgi:hypothetical protein